MPEVIPIVINETDEVLFNQPTSQIVIDLESFILPSETFIEWSILNSICCFFTGSIVLLCTIPAIFFSIKTRELNADHDFVNAKKTSTYSKNCNLLATIVIIQCLIITIIATNLWHNFYCLHI